jgi:hypothetical protein
MAGAVVEFLKKQFVARDGREHRLIHGVMGIFGHGNVAGLGQALDEHGGRDLPYLQPKNEQAMVHTAAAFAKARRRLGTYACTTSVGPGATNMVTGAATATVNRIPVLLLPGDVFLVPRGYHGPSVASPNHDLYYLNVLAGPGAERTMAFCDDPQHHWIRETWGALAPDPRVPVTSAKGRVR